MQVVQALWKYEKATILEKQCNNNKMHGCFTIVDANKMGGGSQAWENTAMGQIDKMVVTTGI